MTVGLDLLGHAGYVALVAGSLAAGSGRAIGWLVRCAGSACWLYVGYELGSTSIVGWSAAFCAVDLRNFFWWVRRGT